MGWCIGATMCAMYCAAEGLGAPVRNLALLTMPVDGRCATYAAWVGNADFDAAGTAERWRVIPGSAIDIANKLLKPVTNYVTTYRRLAQGILDGTARPEAYQSMAKWVGDNPPFPGRAWAQWITWIYQENALVRGRIRLHGRRVDLRRIEQNLLVVTADADHIAPREGTMPIFGLVSSRDITHFDRSGGHIGLIAGSPARKELWPDLAAWLADRSDR